MHSDTHKIHSIDDLGITFEELIFTSPSGNYNVKFDHLENTTFKVIMSGYFDIEAFYGHTAITDKIFNAVKKSKINEKVYFIEDIRELKWYTAEARKAARLKYKDWDIHGGSYVFGANKFLFTLNKLVSTSNQIKYFHFCKNQQEALNKIRENVSIAKIDTHESDDLIIKSPSLEIFNKLWEKKKERITVKGNQYRIINRDEWTYNSANNKLSFKCSIIEGNILLMKLEGFAHTIDIDSVFEILYKIVDELSFNTTSNKFFSIGDFRKMKGVSLKARIKNTQYEENFRQYSNILITIPSTIIGFLLKTHKLLFPSQYRAWHSTDSVESAFEYLLEHHGAQDEDLYLRYTNHIEETADFIIPKNKKQLIKLAEEQHLTIQKSEKQQKEIINNILTTVGKISSGESYSDKLELDFDSDNSFVDIYHAINLLWEDFTEIIKEKENKTWLLVESKERFRHLIDFVPGVSIQGYKTDGTIVYWNKASEIIYGYSREEAIGKNLGDLIIPDNIRYEFDQSLAMSKTITQSGEIAPPGELYLKHKDQSLVPVYSIHTAVCIPKQKPVLFCLDVDLTERKKVEEELQKAHGELEQRVAERTAELKIAKEKAEESDKLKSAFLANMSHEIRTPLNAILGFSSLLSSELEKDKAENYIRTINDSGVQLMNIISDIIDISKIEANQIHINIKSCKINNILSELNQSFKELINRDGSKEIELILKPGEKNPDFAILTDPARLKQIISNLLNNSIKFTEKGYIEFGYNISKQSQSEETKTNEIQFYVKDTGIGIEKEKQEIIFKRFRQIDDTYTSKHGGTGLGLAISKNLIEKLGGRIWIDSIYGKGSVFYFTLPLKLSKNSEKVEAQPQSITKINWKEKTILIAEDVPSNFYIIEILLKKTGAKLLWAKNGLEALEIIKENREKIDLVLMDIQMPVISGIEATKEIKKISNKILIIAITAYALDGDMEKFIKAGCDDYISKPVENELLLRKISYLFSKTHPSPGQ